MQTSFSWTQIKVDFGDSGFIISPIYAIAVVAAITIFQLTVRRAILQGYLDRGRAEAWVINLTYFGSILCILAIGGSSSMFQGRFPIAVVAMPRAITVGLFMLIAAWDLQSFLHAIRNETLPETSSLRAGLQVLIRIIVDKLRTTARSILNSKKKS